MCDPKSHRRCINKGILWRNNKNLGVIPPNSGIIAGACHNSCLYACQSWQSRCQTFILPSTYLFQASCPISLYLHMFSYIPGANNSMHPPARFHSVDLLGKNNGLPLISTLALGSAIHFNLCVENPNRCK